MTLNDWPVEWRHLMSEWLTQKAENTASSYRIAIDTFAQWADFQSTGDYHPEDADVRLAMGFADWLRHEGKAINYDPPTGGEAPWEAKDFDPETAPAWMRWEAPDGRVILRRQEQDDTGEVEVTERGGLSTSSVNLKLAALRGLYEAAFQKGLWPIDKMNPFSADRVNREEPKSQRRPMPSPAELRAVLDAINLTALSGKRDRAIILTAYQTGLRYNELIHLRWGNAKKLLDDKAYTATVDLLKATGRLSFAEGKEPADDEFIWTPLFPDRVRRLYPDASEEEIQAMINTPVTNSTLNVMLKRRATRAGVDPKKMTMAGIRAASQEYDEAIA
jgi:integrase